MFLLACNLFGGRKWKEVAKFAGKRTPTQVRTHIQKFRQKTKKFLVEVDKFIEYCNSLKTMKEKENFKLEPRANHLTTELCSEYLKIYHYSLFREKRDETEPNEGHIVVKYSKKLMENESIPSFIPECEKESYPKEVMESQIDKRMDRFSTALDLLKEIKE